MKRRDFLKTGLKIGVAANTLPMYYTGDGVDSGYKFLPKVLPQLTEFQLY